MKQRIIGLGEIMLRLSPPNTERLLQSPTLNAIFGGGEANTLMSLAQFGLDTTFVSALPTNPIGEACLRFLRSFGVDVSFIQRTDGRMGIYYLEPGANQRPTQAFYDRAHSVIATISPDSFDWDAIFADATWFHLTGIMPALSQTAADIALTAVRAAHERNIIVSCDTSYRSKLWQYGKQPIDVMPHIAEYVNVLFANEFDCRFVYGVEIDETELPDMPSLERRQQIGVSMFERFSHLTHLVFTHRQRFSTSHNAWHASMFNGKIVQESRQYDITHIVDRVGGGDAFAAGLIYGFVTGMSEEEMLNFGAAAACFKHSIPGDINRVNADEVAQLASQKGNLRVQR